MNSAILTVKTPWRFLIKLKIIGQISWGMSPQDREKWTDGMEVPVMRENSALILG